MGGGGLLIFYVTSVACYKSEKSTFCWIFQQRLLDFPTDFPVQKLYLCTEFQSALKLQTSH